MKVLWVTNNSCSSAEMTGRQMETGGWLSALEKEVRDDVELEIAFLSNGRRQDDFTYRGVRYHPIAPFCSVSRILFRIKRLFMSWDRQDRLILKRLGKIIRDSSPDIVHIHGTEKCFGLIYREMHGKDGCIAVGGRKIPIVISIQGIMQEIVRKYFAGIPEEKAVKYGSIGAMLRKQSVMRRYRQLQHQAADEAVILSETKFIIGRTDWDRAMTAGFNPERIYFHVGEIMRPEFYRGKAREEREDDDAGKRPVRLISTFSEGLYKGYELLLKVAAELKRKDTDYIWTVIGYTQKSETVSISEKATGLDSSNLNVRFCGKMDAGSIVRELSRSDIYCQVSHIENSPNSLCEALLLGLPAIATNVGGTATVANNGISAFLVSDTSPAEYARAIIRLAASPEGIISGEGSRIAALIHHDPERIRKQLTDTYTEIIGMTGNQERAVPEGTEKNEDSI